MVCCLRQLHVGGPIFVGREKRVQVFCEAKPWRKGGFIPPAQVKSTGDPWKGLFRWGELHPRTVGNAEF